MWALFNTTLITNSFTGLPPTENNVLIYDNIYPLIEYVGSGKLFVDSIEYPGRLTYSPDAATRRWTPKVFQFAASGTSTSTTGWDDSKLRFTTLLQENTTIITNRFFQIDMCHVLGSSGKENIADNGQFMIGGGHQGRPVDCEIAKVRLWSFGSSWQVVLDLSKE